MSEKALDAYAETSISTQDKGKLVVMLYEGAIKSLRWQNRSWKASVAS